jgi:hypothetical protein
VRRDHHPPVVFTNSRNRLESRWNDTAMRKLELRGGGRGNMVRGCSTGPFIGARVPVHLKQSFKAYLQGNRRSIR